MIEENASALLISIRSCIPTPIFLEILQKHLQLVDILSTWTLSCHLKLQVHLPDPFTMDTEKQNTVGSVHEEMSPTAEVAYLANQEDHETSRLQAIRSNPWAFAWCIFAVWTTLLVSYENQASSTILGIPQFRKDFGSYFDGNYVLPAAWQAAFGGGAVAV